MTVSDRELFEMLRARAHRLAMDAAKELAPAQSSDGKMAPHVARERIIKLRKLARQFDAVANLAEVL